MLRNITTLLKAKKYLRENQYFRAIPVIYLYKNSVLSAAESSFKKIPNKTVRPHPAVPACGKPATICGKSCTTVWKRWGIFGEN
jgi:hypothetical protein